MNTPKTTTFDQPAGAARVVADGEARSWWQPVPANGYVEVRKDMRGRYPRHYWPEDPLTAEPRRGVRRPV